MPGDHADHRFPRPQGLVQCEAMLIIVWPSGTYAKRSSAKSEQQVNAGGLSHLEETLPGTNTLG